MTKVSEKVVELVFDVLVDASEPLTARAVAKQVNLHHTTVGDALRQLLERGVAVRSVGKGTHGHPPYVYVIDGVAQTVPAPATRTDTNRHRPVTKRRAKRGSMDRLVRDALSHWSPSGRGFTTSQMQKYLGQGSYETVRRSIDSLVASGEIVKTDGCRSRSRVYLPAAAAPPAPITAPESPAVPINLSGVDALFAERETILKRHAADELRLAELDVAFDALRARLS